MGILSLFQGIFPTQGSNPGLPHCRWILYQLNHKGSPIPKKGNVKEYSNYHTIVLISHASKVMLKIRQVRLQQYVNRELPMFKLDLEKAEEPEIKLSTSIGSWKRQENSRKLLDCFIDCAKAFDSVDFNKLWKILKNMIIPEYFNCLLRNT